MTDQDLIAEGREVLTACAILRADDELTRWAKNNLPAVLAELERARRRIADLESISEKRRVRMVAAEEDITEVRGLLSPQGYPRRIPDEVEIGESVAPAVEWLLARIAELESEAQADQRAIEEARDEARSRIAELEAAQRPPLGYVAGYPDILGGQLLIQADAERAFGTRESAQRCVDQLNGLGDCVDEWFVLEIRREVQP